MGCRFEGTLNAENCQWPFRWALLAHHQLGILTKHDGRDKRPAHEKAKRVSHGEIRYTETNYDEYILCITPEKSSFSSIVFNACVGHGLVQLHFGARRA
jgi:hypothetical protein